MPAKNGILSDTSLDVDGIRGEESEDQLRSVVKRECMGSKNFLMEGTIFAIVLFSERAIERQCSVEENERSMTLI